MSRVCLTIPKRPVPVAAFQDYFSKRVFPERHVFVILDGQNLNEINKELKFSYIEINTRLCKTIP